MHETGPHELTGNEIDDLLDQVLAAPEGSCTAALEDLCRAFPEQAPVLRRRFGHLQRCGMVDDNGQGGSGRTLPAQGSRFGPYELGAILGHGAMGVVFRAVDTTTGATVALKLIRQELLDDVAARRRFVHEGEVAARVQHQHLCRVHAVGEVDGTPFLAMDLLTGETLAARLERARRLGRALSHGWPGIVAMFEKVARALGCAHAAGLVHRDVKPGNLMIGADGEPVLFDFGLAFSAGTTRFTRTGSVLGTPAYMSPEQVRGIENVTPRADVYSFGASLYEALSLRPPFGLLEREALYRRILHDEPDDLRRLVPHLPRALAWVVHRCLEKHPRRRYRDANELADDLAQVRQGQPPSARPPGPLRRLVRRARRHPVVASLLFAASLAVVGLSLFVWQARRQADLQSVLVALSAERLSGRNAVVAANIAREEFEREPVAATRSALVASLLGLHQCDEVRQQFLAGWSADLPDGRLICIMGGVSEPRTVSSAAGTWTGVLLHGGWCGAISQNGHHYAVVWGDRPPPELRTSATTPRPRLFTTSGGEIPLRKSIVVEQNVRYIPRPVLEFDEGLLYVGDTQGCVTVFDSAGVEVDTWQPHAGATIHSLWALGRGRVLTVAVEDGVSNTLRDVKVSSAGQPEGSVLCTGSADRVVKAAVSGDRSRLFLALDSGDAVPQRLRCVAVDGGEVTETALPTPRHNVNVIAADGSGEHAVVGSAGGHNMVYLLEPGSEPGRFRLHPLGPTESAGIAAAFAAATGDGPNYFAVGEWAGPIHVYTLADGLEIAVLRGHESAVTHLRFTPDGSDLVSASWDGTIRRWRLGLPGLPKVGVAHSVMAVTWLPDGEHFVVATLYSELALFDRRGRQLGPTVHADPGVGTPILATAFAGHPLAPEETVIAFGGENQPLAFWACRPGAAEPLRKLPSPPVADDPLRPLSFRFTRDHCLLVGARIPRGGVELFGADGKQLWSAGPEDRHTALVGGIDSCANGRLVVSGGGFAVKLWERHQGEDGPGLLARGTVLEADCSVSAVAFAPDDDGTLLVGLGDGRVLWFELDTRTERVIGHHDGAVRTVAFSHDGTLMLSSGHDRMAKVWTRSGEPFVELPHGGVVFKAAFAPDDRHVLTGSHDRTARIWPVTDEELTRLARELPFRGLEPGERERRVGGR